MSRHMMAQEGKRLVFGWDQPLTSFYLQVHDRTRAADDQIVAWLGATPETQMYEVEHLVRAASEHGFQIDHRMQIQLHEEKDNGS